nr:PREDICTED: exportin-6-A isoform X2 [Bemisia tabaci]
MSHSDNQYIWMFCLTNVIETVITQRWISLESNERAELRSFLYNAAVSPDSTIPLFIRNKLIKLMCIIAKFDWPHFYPDFFVNIINLIQSRTTTKVGLLILKTASEELITLKEDISASRKEELQRLFQAHLPQVFTILTAVLESSNNNEDTCELALETCAHLFSWAPLGPHFTPSLLQIVFNFTSDRGDLGAVALSALNEILYKNCVPVTSLPLILWLCEQACHLLQNLVKIENSSCSYNFSLKFIDLIKQVIVTHWHRVESSPNFPAKEFLLAFLRFTFQQTHVEFYYDCLDTWCSFLDYLQLQDCDHILEYGTILLKLVRDLLVYLNQEKELSNDSLNQDEESPKQEFVRLTVGVIEKVCDVLPSQEEVCSMVYEQWQSACAIYTNVLSSNANPQTIQEKDLASLCLILSKLHPYLKPTPAQTSIISTLVHLASTSTQLKLYSDPSYSSYKYFSSTLLRIHCELFASLHTWLSQNSELDEAVYQKALSSCLEYVLPPQSEPRFTPITLQRAAAHLFSCLAYKPHLLPLCFQPLVDNLALTHLDPKARLVVHATLFKCILALQNISFNERLNILTNFFGTLVKVETLSHLTSLLECCKPDKQAEKKLLYAALQPILAKIITEFHQQLSQNSNVCVDMLALFLEAFKSLHDQMGSSFTSEAITTLMDCYNGSNITIGIDKLLQLLMFIVELPSSAFKHFVPCCINLCMQLLLPDNGTHVNPDIKAPLFQLVFSILLHKWQYFYQNSLYDAQVPVDKVDSLKKVLTAVGMSLMESDVTLFAENLKSLEVINEKWKLYSRDFFKSNFLDCFLNVLLNILIQKSHSLLIDDIITAIFNLSSVNFDIFFSHFIPVFLESIEGLDDNQRRSLRQNMRTDTDLPSFSVNISRFISDICRYLIFNDARAPS